MRDAIGLVVEHIRIQGIKIFQHIVLQDLCMQRCYTIDAMRTHDGQMSHVDLSVFDDGDIVYDITMSVMRELETETTIDLFDDHIYAR